MLMEYYNDPPRGRKRYLDPLWGYHVHQYVYPNGDYDFFEYSEWVSQGGGDDDCLSSPSSCVQSGFLTDNESE